MTDNTGDDNNTKENENGFSEVFLKALEEDFMINGGSAIDYARENKPDVYLRIIETAISKQGKKDDLSKIWSPGEIAKRKSDLIEKIINLSTQMATGKDPGKPDA